MVHKAAQWGKFEMVEALLGHLSEDERREVIREKDGNGWTVVHRLGRGTVERLLLKIQNKEKDGIVE